MVSDAIDESALCLACGLCCRDAIFDGLPLAPQEEGDFIGDEAVGARDRSCAGMPCSKLEDTRCSVYERRPAVCRSYRCELLNRFQEGKVTGLAAMALIATARKLERAAPRAAPGDLSLGEARSQWFHEPQAWRSLEGAEREDSLNFTMALTALNLHLDRHFLRDYQRMTGLVGKRRTER